LNLEEGGAPCRRRKNGACGNETAQSCAGDFCGGGLVLSTLAETGGGKAKERPNHRRGGGGCFARKGGRRQTKGKSRSAVRFRNQRKKAKWFFKKKCLSKKGGNRYASKGRRGQKGESIPSGPAKGKRGPNQLWGRGKKRAP